MTNELVRAVAIEALGGKCESCGNPDPDKLVFHHINGDRSDNRPSNAALLCHSCHTKIHKKDEDEDTPTEVITVRVPESIRRGVEKLSQKKNRTMGETIRRGINIIRNEEVLPGLPEVEGDMTETVTFEVSESTKGLLESVAGMESMSVGGVVRSCIIRAIDEHITNRHKPSERNYVSKRRKRLEQLERLRRLDDTIRGWWVRKKDLEVLSAKSNVPRHIVLAGMRQIGIDVPLNIPMKEDFFKKYWEDGFTEKMIADALDMTRSEVRDTKVNLELNERVDMWPDDPDEKFKGMWNTGVLIRDIAEEFDVSRSTVHRRRMELGLDPREDHS